MVSYRTDLAPRTTPIEPGVSALSLSHVANTYQCYPGESVTFYTRLDAHESLPSFTLRVMIPSGLILKNYLTTTMQGSATPQIYEEVDGTFIVWQQQDVAAGERYEYVVEAEIAHTKWDVSLDSRARAIIHKPDKEPLLAEESTTVSVSAKGQYLRYLPSLYDQDELMGRFLMLFESFWKPIEQQIGNIYYYFDPALAPVELLPWLASWLDLILDERWSEEKRRYLLQYAAHLYRKRGTKQGLEEYLEIYTGYKPKIIEHRAHNFMVGRAAKLGPAIALGKRNIPHTFTIILRLPPVETDDSADQNYKEAERRRAIEKIIEAEKPAHTAYVLIIETLDSVAEVPRPGPVFNPSN